MIKTEDIRTQVEYYLSDNNLKKDQFFYEKIKENDDGWVEIGLLLNCNKIKNMGVSADSIVQAIKGSTEVEVDPEGKHIRRKGNKALPEATFKSKKLKVQGKPEGITLQQPHTNDAGKDGKPLVGGETNGIDAKGSEEFIPLILFIHETSHLDKVVGKEFEQALGEAFKVQVPFARIGKYDGNVVFDSSTLTQDVLDKLLSDGFTYQDKKVTFKAGSDKEVDEFMRNHGRHVGKIIQKSSR